MKLIRLVLLFSFIAQSSWAAVRVVGLDEINLALKNKNYQVRESAIQVQAARANIERARADLLPRLNIWTIAQIAISPADFFNPFEIIGTITDIAPFLVPGNWFRVEENRILYKAEREGFRALKVNHLHAARALYYRIHFDLQLLSLTEDSARELEQAQKAVEIQERLGGVRPGTARDLEIKVLGLKEDSVNLRLLIGEEMLELGHMIGLSAEESFELRPLVVFDPEGQARIDALTYQPRILSVSPERKQFDHILAALQYVKKEIQWSFFGVSSISRGVAGGVFDSIPISPSLFGNDSSIKIAIKKGQILRLQKKGVEEVLKRQLRNLANQFNSDISNYSLFLRRAQLSLESNRSLLERARLGESINSLEYSENLRNRIQAQASHLGSVMRMRINRDRLNRMTFQGPYKNY